MAEVKVSIGGREFEVACRDGEEHFLLSAAQLLDNEASALNEALGRMPENRMLLMSGLMLADKTASLEDQLKSASRSVQDAVPGAARQRIDRLEQQLGEAQAIMADLNARLSEADAGMSQAADRLSEMEDALAEVTGKCEAAETERDDALDALRRIVEKVEAAAAAKG